MWKFIEGGSRPREQAQRFEAAGPFGVSIVVGVLAVGLLTGCASEPPPPAQAPEPPIPAAPAPSPAPPADTPETSALTEPAPSPATAPPPAAEPTAPTRPAIDVITEADTDFLLDDAASGLKEAARQKCEATAAGASDPKALAECRQKERDKFGGDVLSFQAEEGAVRLIIYRRKASRLDEVYQAPVTLKEQGPTTVLVTSKGGKGARPFLYAQREFSLEVPDNYTLMIEDPSLGKLVYRAKVGVVAR